jgi:hypothetical protein
MLFFHWIAARFSAPPISIIKSNLLPTVCLIRLQKTPNFYILTLKMATAMFAETLDNSQH